MDLVSIKAHHDDDNNLIPCMCPSSSDQICTRTVLDVWMNSDMKTDDNARTTVICRKGRRRSCMIGFGLVVTYYFA
jgi:hypothetical protein